MSMQDIANVLETALAKADPRDREVLRMAVEQYARRHWRAVEEARENRAARLLLDAVIAGSGAQAGAVPGPP